jgi:hypothetical protein
MKLPPVLASMTYLELKGLTPLTAVARSGMNKSAVLFIGRTGAIVEVIFFLPYMFYYKNFKKFDEHLKPASSLLQAINLRIKKEKKFCCYF